MVCVLRNLATALAFPVAAVGKAWGTFELRKEKGYCLDIPGGDRQNGNWLWVWECTGSDSQNFVWEDDGSIRTTAGNKCIDVPGGDPDRGWDLWLWDCNGSDSQKWMYAPNPISGAPELGGAVIYAPYGDWSNGNARCVDLMYGEGAVGNGAQLALGACSKNENNGEPWLTPNQPIAAEMNSTVVV